MPIELRRYRATRFDTFYLLGLIMLSVSGQMLSGDFSTAITDTVPKWEAYTSTSALLLGTSVTLVGVAWRGSNLAALQIEQVGRVILAFPAFCYGIAVLYYAQWHAALTGALLLWLTASCALRWREIYCAIQKHYEILVEIKPEE